MKLYLVRCDMCNADCTAEYYVLDFNYTSIDGDNVLRSKPSKDTIELCPECFSKVKKILPDLFANIEFAEYDDEED